MSSIGLTPPFLQPLDISDHPSLDETHSVQSHGSIAEVVSVATQTQIRAISDYLKDQVFAVHRQSEKVTPPGASQGERESIAEHNQTVRSNNQQLDDIADSRARVLQGLGETPASIADTMAKAEKFDRLATTSSSAFRGMPFAAATVLQYMEPAINKGDWLPAPLKPLTPLISGALSGVMDQVGTGVMNRVTDDAHFLKASPEKLHDALVNSMKGHTPGLVQQTIDSGGAIQSFSARNVLRTVLATSLAAHPKAQAVVDTSVSAIGGLAASAVFGNRIHTTSSRDHQRGAAYVFARKDAEPKALDDETEWLEAYRGIKNASYTGAVINAGKRVAGMPIDVITDSSKAVRSLVSASSLTQNGLALAGGFAGVGKLQELATKNISNPYAKAAVSQLTNLAGSAGVFAAWTTAGVLTDPGTKAAEHLLQDTLKQASSDSVSYLGKQLTAGAKEGVRLGGAGLNAAADAAVTTGAALRAQYSNLTTRRGNREDDSIETV